jgi:hypothetical protein
LLFWTLSFVSHVGLIFYAQSNKNDLEQEMKDQLWKEVKQFDVLLGLYFSMIFITLFLMTMGIAYRNEYMFNENRTMSKRNYLPTANA